MLVGFAGIAFVTDPTGITGIALFSGVLYVPLFVLYKTGMEGWYGQTLGKSARNLTVREMDGSRCHWRAAVIRNLLLLLDFLPWLYFLGAYAANRTDEHQRLGDIVAETVVVGRAA